MQAEPVNLTMLAAGQEVRVRALQGANGHTQRLRELGLLDGRTLRIVDNRNPMIVEIGSCRFGVCRRLARCIMVEPAGQTLGDSSTRDDTLRQAHCDEPHDAPHPAEGGCGRGHRHRRGRRRGRAWAWMRRSASPTA